MRNFRELNVWKQGMDVAKEVYIILPNLTDSEKFGMKVQLATSACSIPSNIAEGCGKSSDRDFKRYLEISLGSSYELETHLILASEIQGLHSDSILLKFKKSK